MSIGALRRRIDTMLVQIHQTLPAEQEPSTFQFAMYLFSAAEQQRLASFMERIEPLYSYYPSGHLSLSKLSTAEFDELGSWVRLEDALQREDLETAAKYRRSLALPVEQLIAQFLALDLSFLPTDLNAPGIHIQEGHCIYSLDRGSYRNIVINHIERNRISRDTIDDIRRWLDYAA